MKPDTMVQKLYEEAVEIPEPYSSLSELEKQAAAKLLVRFKKAETKYGALPRREILYPMLLSKNGQHDEASAVAKGLYRENPSWDTAVAAANAARRRGDPDHAAKMFARAARHDPEDDTCWLEVGDIRLEQEQFRAALRAYEKALAIDAEHPWALPSAFYCRHRLGRKGDWLASLREFANQEGCTCGLEACLTAMFGGYGASQGIARAQYLLDKLRGDGAHSSGI